MANFDDQVKVTVLTDAPPISRAGFGTVLVVCDPGTSPAAVREVKTYKTLKDFIADKDEYSVGGQVIVQGAFSSKVAPSQVKVFVTAAANSANYNVNLDEAVAKDGEFYGIVCEGLVQADIVKVATWAEANKRFYLAQSGAPHVDQLAVATVLEAASYERTAYLACNAPQAAAVWLSTCLGVNPDVQTTTWRYHSLPTVPKEVRSATEQTALDAKNANMYGSFYGQGATGAGVTCDGTPIDIRVTKDWTLARVSEAIAQLLLNASARGSKVPYSDEGFAMIEAQVRQVLQQGEGAGHFIGGSSFVRMPRRSEVSAADAANRHLSFSFGAALAGAVETLVVEGVLSTDLDFITGLAG